MNNLGQYPVTGPVGNPQSLPPVYTPQQAQALRSLFQASIPVAHTLSATPKVCGSRNVAPIYSVQQQPSHVVVTPQAVVAPQVSMLTTATASIHVLRQHDRNAAAKRANGKF